MSDRTAKSFTVSTSTGLVTAYDTAPTYSKPQANGGDSMGTSDGGQSGQTLSGAAVSYQLVLVPPPHGVSCRLTPNIVEFISPFGVEGVFVPVVNAAALAVTVSKSHIEEYLRLFVLADMRQQLPTLFLAQGQLHSAVAREAGQAGGGSRGCGICSPCCRVYARRTLCGLCQPHCTV